jgi:type II secretory pathway pseudopilin PulG
MPRAFRSQTISTARLRDCRKQRGYMLITMMLALALISIALLTVLPDIAQQIRRDREEELIHRGTAYMRAVQSFHRKLGRYPTRIEELENTNNIRFIRKLYKDPMTRDRATGQEKSFKVLNETDISLISGTVLGQPTGQRGLAAAGEQQDQNGSGIGAQPGGPQARGTQNRSTGASASSSDDNPSDQQEDSTSPESAPPDSDSGSGQNGPTFGGGPILGVVSTSKEKSIHVFNNKDHYKDWLFVYIQALDYGGQLKGPLNTSRPPGGFGGMAPGQTVSGAAGQGQTSPPGAQTAPPTESTPPN